jgi:anaerobic selenocysteine-containing dehydrogenase
VIRFDRLARLVLEGSERIVPVVEITSSRGVIMHGNVFSKIRSLEVIALLLGTAASAGAQGGMFGAPAAAGYHVKNFSACEVHRNAYNT